MTDKLVRLLTPFGRGANACGGRFHDANTARLRNRRRCDPQKEPQPSQRLLCNHQWFDAAHGHVFNQIFAESKDNCKQPIQQG